MGEPAGAIIVQTVVGVMALGITVIMGRFLLWPLFKKQPVVVGTSFAIGIIAIVLMFVFNA